MTKLQELFYNHIKSNHYRGHAESIGTLKAWDNCIKAIENIPESAQSEIESLISGYGLEREELGFINGFRYGVEIMALCFIESGEVND